jgi:hypothetical protein
VRAGAGSKLVRKSWSIVLVGWLLVVLAVPAHAREPLRELVTISTRPNVTVRVGIDQPSSPPRAILLQFPGGNGANHLRPQPDGTVQLSGNFLLRATPRFLEQSLLTVVVDTPSDRPQGMGDGFRQSAAHRQDIQAVLDYLGSRWDLPVYLSGTSRGTISAAYLGRTLADPRVAGLVLTATLDQLAQQPLDAITRPVLMVHHRDDGCSESTFVGAEATFARFTASPRATFGAVEGGDPPRSGPCDALSPHGFWGIEPHVVQVIADWIGG